MSHGTICVIRLAHGIIVDAQLFSGCQELGLDLWQICKPSEVAAAGQDEGAIVIDERAGGTPRYKDVVRVWEGHVLVVLNLKGECCTVTNDWYMVW